MTIKEFAKEAIKNGHGNGNCEGWEWIGANLSELDYIFQTEAYKEKKGMKSLCMPLLTAGAGLDSGEEAAISTAWYLNNEMEYKRIKKEYKEKMINEGYQELTEEAIRKAFTGKKRLLIVAKTTNDWLTYNISETFKPFISADDKCYLMKPKATRKGFYWRHFEDAFFKEAGK